MKSSYEAAIVAAFLDLNLFKSFSFGCETHGGEILPIVYEGVVTLVALAIFWIVVRYGIFGFIELMARRNWYS